MASGDIRRVAVVGVGLIGGSVRGCGQAARRRSARACGIDLDPVALEYAIEHGIIDDGSLPDRRSARGVARPATVSISWSSRRRPGASASGSTVLGRLGYTGIVTDVASTKSRRARAPRATCCRTRRASWADIRWPGSELSGVTAARADLFDGAYWLLTPAADTDPDAFSAVHALDRLARCARDLGRRRDRTTRRSRS